jgi:hypothetical protein
MLLTACGSTATGAAIDPNGPTTPTPTAVKGYGTSNGCPSDMVIGTAPPKANVTINQADATKTIAAQNGDIIEIDLPFGHKWGGPTNSQGILELQNPAGYAWKTSNTCIWRFVAKGAGTVQLNFSGRALCKSGEMCPMYVVNIPFTIEVK